MNKLEIRKALLCAFLLFFTFFLLQRRSNLSDSYIGKEISVILSEIPKSDRANLECFFRESIGWEQFGYVLLGEKPMALQVIDEKIHPFKNLSEFRMAITPRRIKYAKGFKKWKKYEKFFPMTRFAFFYEDHLDGNPLVILVNKGAFIQKVNENKEDFRKILNREVTGEDLLKEGLNKPLLSQVLMNHDALIGILLGYGKENAYLCHELSQMDSEEKKQEFCERFHFHSAWTDEEFEDFRKQFISISWLSMFITGAHMKDLNLMSLPGFAAVVDSAETKAWRRHYIETKKKIIEFYKDKDFLEATLRLLTQACPPTLP